MHEGADTILLKNHKNSSIVDEKTTNYIYWDDRVFSTSGEKFSFQILQSTVLN